MTLEFADLEFADADDEKNVDSVDTFHAAWLQERTT